MPLRKKPGLSLAVEDPDDVTDGDGGGAEGGHGGPMVKESSFRVTDHTFRRGDVAIGTNGMKDPSGGAPRNRLRAEDLEQVRELGRGNGGVVRGGRRGQRERP